MIPVLVGVGAIVGKTIYDMNKSDQLNEQAEKKLKRAYSKISEAQANQELIEETMEKAVLRLTNRKKGVLTTTMSSFLTLYEKIIKINFTESDGIRELNNFTPMVAQEMSMQISVVRSLPSTPVITKNVVVGCLLGGILSGGLAGCFMGAVTASIIDDSQQNLDRARLQAKQADVIVTQLETINLSYNAITERVDRITDVLTKLNFLFFKGIEESEKLIEKNGSDKKRYSLDERETLAACINMAGAIKNILDTPIIEKDGELTKKSMEAILIGEKCLQAMNAAMN